MLYNVDVSRFLIYIKIISFDLEKELLRGKIYDKHAWFEALVFLHGSCYIFFLKKDIETIVTLINFLEMIKRANISMLLYQQDLISISLQTCC